MRAHPNGRKYWRLNDRHAGRTGPRMGAARSVVRSIRSLFVSANVQHELALMVAGIELA